MICRNSNNVLVSFGAFVLLLMLSFLLVAVEPSAGMSVALAEAVEAEFQAHVRNMELRAAEMQDLHTRAIYKLRRRRDEAHARARRSSSYVLTSHKHGFIPGTGIGNREALGLGDAQFIPSLSLVNVSVELWEEFSYRKRQYLVAAGPSSVQIFQFSEQGFRPLGDPLLSIYQLDMTVRAMTTFTQSYYIGGSVSYETKVALVSDDATIILTVQDNNTFSVQNVTDPPSRVTAVKFFSVGLDSYLIFTQNDDDAAGSRNITMSSIYLWSANSQIFDLRQQIRTYGAVGVEAFEIHGMHYILTVERRNTSTLWRYNTRQNQFRAYQHLEPQGVKNSLYFTLSYEHYVVFIREGDQKSVFYLWDGVRFQMDQVVDTPAASSWSILRGSLTCQDIGLLILSSLQPWPGSITLFNISDEHRFVGEQVPAGEFSDDVQGAVSVMPFFNWFEKTFAIIVYDLQVKGSVQRMSLLFEITERIIPRGSPYSAWAQEAFEKAFTVVEEYLATYESKVVDLTAELEDAVTLSDGDITVGGDFIFNGTITFNGTVEIVTVEADTVYSNNTIAGVDAGPILDSFETNVTKNEDAIEALQALFDDRVTLDGDQTITGPKTFKDLTVDNVLVSNAIAATTINDVDIETLDDEMLRDNIDGQTVNGLLFFNQGLDVDGDIVLDDGVLVNGFDLSNAVTESGAQTITGTKSFSQDVTLQANAVFGTDVTLNSIDISEEVVTLSGDHTLDERITFEDALSITGDIVTPSTVDTIDVSALAPDVVLVDEPSGSVGPLGVESRTIPDSSLSASSERHAYNAPSRGRLNTVTDTDGYGAWTPFTIDGNEWIQVDLGSLYHVVAVATQGRQDIGMWVTSYKVYYSSDGVTFVTVTDNAGSEVVFPGNSDQDTVVENDLPAPVVCQYVRILPVSWYMFIGLRMEIYGKEPGQTITGSVTFAQSVAANADVSTNGNFHNLDLVDWSDRAVRINVDTVITESKTFEDDLSISGDLSNQNNIIDGFDIFLDSLLATYSSSSLQTPLISGIMFPYGTSVGDFAVPFLDDGTYHLNLNVAGGYSLFGQRHSSIYININGIFSFGSGVSKWTPSPFPINNQIYIAPFWADIDTRYGGAIYYRQVTRTSPDDVIFREVDRVVCSSFRNHFYSTWLLISTWHEVPYYGSTGSARNTFQTVLATDGEFSITIVNYDSIEWTTGTASGGDEATGLGGTPALVGFNAGDDVKYYEVGVSRSAGVVDMDVTSNIDVTGRWVFKTDGATIRSTAVQGQTVTGKKIFTHECLTVDGFYVEGTIDGIDLADTVTLTGTHTITAIKTFQDGIEVEGHIFPSGTVDGVDLSMFVPTVMTRTTAQTIQGTVIFNDTLEAGKSLNVVGDINGVDIAALASDAVYSNTATEQVITAAKTFTQSVNAPTGILDFDGLVNGYDMTTDFMDLSTAQTVTVAKTFKDGFSATSHMMVDGTVDGVDIETLWDDAALTTRDDTLSGAKTFSGDATVSGAVTLTGTLNTVDLSEDIMMVNEAQTVNDDKQFGVVYVTGDVSTGSASVTTLNGQDWTTFVTDRVTLSTDQSISGGATFTDQLTVNGNIETDDLVNGIDLPTFEDSLLYITGDQTVTGSYDLTDTTTFDGAVTLAKLLDGVDIDDMESRAIYLDDGTQTITARKIFRDDLAIVNDLTIGDLLNNIDLSALNADIVWTNQGAQTIAGEKIFTDGFTVQGNIAITGTVNSVDISEDVLTLNRAQDITGSYTFEDDVTIVQDLSVSGLINGVNITEVDQDAMKLDVVQTVASSIVFNSDVIVQGSITVADGDTVDTVDLSELYDTAKFKDVAFSLPNDVNFSQPLDLSSLDVTGTVHGIDFQAWAATVLTKDTTQTITGAYNIPGTLQGDIDVNIPGSLLAETAYGIDIDDFVADLVMLQGDLTITGTKTFQSQVTVEGDVTVDGTVDGIDISVDIVTLDGEQTITGSKTFDTCDVNTAQNILTTGEVNGYEISQEAADTLDFRTPKKVTGRKTFSNNVDVTGNLQVDGLVDGKDLDQGFTLNTAQTITAYIMFNAKATVTGDIAVGGYVQGENLTYIDLKRITLDENHTVEGALTFYNMSFFSKNITTDYLFDGVDLSALAVLVDLHYEEYEEDIYELGCYAETQCQRTEELAEVVNNFIDAIDYVEEVQFLQQHIRQFETLAIDGVTYLAAAVYADENGDVCTTSIIYQWEANTRTFVEFQRISTNAAVVWKHFMIGNDNFLIVANSGHTACHDTPSTNVVYMFDGYNFTSVGSVGEELAATSDLLVVTIDGMHFLVLTTYDGSIATVYKYNEQSTTFEVFQDIPTGVTSSVESLVMPKGTYLIFTLYLEVRSVVYCFISNTQTFDYFQDVDSEHAREIESFHFNDRYGFAVADHISVSDIGATFEVSVRIFYWDDQTEQFVQEYSLPVVSPGDVDIFLEGNFIYASVVQEYQSIDIFRFEGSAGFVEAYRIPFHGVRSVGFFNLQDDEYAVAADEYEYDQLFMAVAVDPFTPQDVASHILKVVNLGGSVQMRKWEDMCESNLRDTTWISPQPPTC